MAAEQFQLTFGSQGRFDGTIAPSRLVGQFLPPVAVASVRQAVADAAAAPSDFPPLHQALVPGDRVVIVLDRTTPQASEVIAGLWDELQKREIAPGDITILQPASILVEPALDPRSALPEAIRESVRWHLHDPLPEDSCTYLASTAGGERVYLSRELVDADVTILVGPVVFDRVWGYRGLQTLMYPGLSNLEALKKSLGQPHEELQIDDSRPLRQMADEISWLLGVHFAVGLVPASGGSVSHVIAGTAESVMRQCQTSLNSQWRFQTDKAPELVLVSVDHPLTGQGWENLANALHTARGIVAKDGRIGVLTELKAALTEGLQMIRDVQKPRDAMRPLREQAPPDLLAATTLAKAVDWANVYLLSGLDPDLVEEMFMVPLADVGEVVRLISGTDSIAIIGSGQFVSTDPLPEPVLSRAESDDEEEAPDLE